MKNKKFSIKKNQPIDEKTIATLKRGDRYKLFKYSITIDAKNQVRLEMFYRILDEMPELEICEIVVGNGDNDVINTLAANSMFNTKQDLFNILEFYIEDQNQQSEPCEYVTYINYSEKYDMS